MGIKAPKPPVKKLPVYRLKQGWTLQDYRLKQGWTLRQLSKLTGLSPATLWRIETGKIQPGARARIKLHSLLPDDAKQHLPKPHKYYKGRPVYAIEDLQDPQVEFPLPPEPEWEVEWRKRNPDAAKK
jgi:transcriptional regulator with XRE-family HTH domain